MSARMLVAATAASKPNPGKTPNPPLSGQGVLQALGDHDAPFGCRNLGAEPYEAERCKGEHGVSEQCGGLDEQSGYRMRDDVPEDNPGRPCARRFRCLDEGQPPDPEHVAPYESGVIRHRSQHDPEGGGFQAPAEPDGHGHRQDQRREREDRVHDAHQGVVE